MSKSELLEWQEYYALEPFLPDRIERLLVQLTSMVGGFMGSKAEYHDYFVSDIPKPTKQKKLEDKLSKLFGDTSK